MKGLCVIITNPNGAVVASAVDFDGVDASGFSRESEQSRRAKARAFLAFAKSHLNHWMAEKVTHEDAIGMWSLAESAGYQMTIIPIDVAKP